MAKIGEGLKGLDLNDAKMVWMDRDERKLGACFVSVSFVFFNYKNKLIQVISFKSRHLVVKLDILTTTSPFYRYSALKCINHG